MTKQVLYNLEITRGDSSDYLEWAFKANSFHDAALILASHLEMHTADTIEISGHKYTFENRSQTPFSFYPAFFYVAAHSIELILKAIGIQASIPLDIITRNGHKLRDLIDSINQTSFLLPNLTTGEMLIIKNLELVLITGAVKYPNAKGNTEQIYSSIKADILQETEERVMVDKTDNNTAVVGIIEDISESHYTIKKIKAVEDSSLNIVTYSQLWRKFSDSLDKAVAKELHLRMQPEADC